MHSESNLGNLKKIKIDDTVLLLTLFFFVHFHNL